MKILLTGGNGFIGSHVRDSLLENGYEIIVLDKCITNKNYYSHHTIKYYQMDINDSSVENIFAIERPDVIIHLAAQISVASSMNDPVNDVKNNVFGTIKLLQYAANFHVKKVIFASSAAVYGIPNYLPIDENHPIQPISFYGMSKAVGEQYVQLYKEVYNIDFSILRFSNVYGPGQSAEGEAGVISIFSDRIQNNMPITIYGDGKQTRDFVYVKDVANACVKAIHTNGSHIANISSNSVLTINELVKYFSLYSEQSIVLTYEPVIAADIRHSQLINHVARNILQWEPMYTIQDGLTETLNSLVLTKNKIKST